MRRRFTGLLLLLAGCASDRAVDTAAPLIGPWADAVLEATSATGTGFKNADLAVNGARGGGARAGTTDVYSLALQPDDVLVLAWTDQVVTDGPGVDLVVFENPFDYGASGSRFMDPVVVSVSADGIDFVAFPHDYSAQDPTSWSAQPSDWQGFAGLTPVLLHEDDNPVDPFDAAAAGGDGFDLADLPPDDPVTQAIASTGVVAVRLISAAVVDHPATGVPYPRDPSSDGADIDAVYARYLGAR